MTTIVLYRPGAPRPPRRHPKARLRAGKVEVELPFAPVDVEHTPRQRAWSQQERPGRAPLLLDDGTTLATMRWTPLVAQLDVETSIEGLIDRLQKLVAGRDRVRVAGMSRRERGPWVLTGLTYTVLARQQGTNAITQARLTLTFTEPSSANPRLGPVHGGKDGKGGDGKVRHYVVKKGDTLRAIANRFYDDPSKWTVIAKANGIKDPSRLRVGARLKIPAQGGG